MNGIILQARVAPRNGGHGVRLFLKSMAGAMPGVWAGQGYKEGDRDKVPEGATATFEGGYTWEDQSQAEAWMNDLMRNQRNEVDIHAEAVAAGLEIDHWQSDLYIKRTPAADALIQSYRDRVGKNFDSSKLFKGTDGFWWYEVPFSYTPFWKERGL